MSTYPIDIVPTVLDVAALLRARTKDSNGHEVGAPARVKVAGVFQPRLDVGDLELDAAEDDCVRHALGYAASMLRTEQDRCSARARLSSHRSRASMVT